MTIGELSVELLAQIKTSLDDNKDVLEKLLRIQDDYQPRGPIYTPIGGQGTSDSVSSPLVIDLGGPAQLRRWELRQLIVGGVLFSSVVAGTALLVQSPSAVNAKEPSLPSVEDQATSLPSKAFYSSGQVIVRAPNHLYVVIMNPTASTAYTVGGEALSSPDVALRSVNVE